MERATKTKSEILKELFLKYNLFYDNSNPENKDNEIYAHKHYTIITRAGIDKIQKIANIEINYTPIYVDAANVVLHAKGRKIDANGVVHTIETFGSASSATSKSAYYAEMAEKRAMSRVVLKLEGLYELNVMGQDESDEWSSTPADRARTQTAKYKAQ